MTNYTTLRSSLVDCYSAYLDSNQRTADYFMKRYHIGDKLYKPGYHYEDDWFTPTGRKRKLPKKVKVQNFIIVDQEWLDKTRASYIKTPDKFLGFKFEIGDWTTSYGFNDWNNISDEEIEATINRIPKEFRNHLIKFEAKLYNYYGGNDYFFSNISPVFDSETQKIWDEYQNNYIKAKSDWCSKYGCE